jgi:hypothetical protein
MSITELTLSTPTGLGVENPPPNERRLPADVSTVLLVKQSGVNGPARIPGWTALPTDVFVRQSGVNGPAWISISTLSITELPPTMQSPKGERTAFFRDRGLFSSGIVLTEIGLKLALPALVPAKLVFLLTGSSGDRGDRDQSDLLGPFKNSFPMVIQLELWFSWSGFCSR